MDKPSSKNPFRRENSNQKPKSQKESEWGKVKFNPVAARTPIVEKATPWSQLKNDLIQEQSKYTIQKNDEDYQKIQKEKAEKYRRLLIESKRNQPTTWDDFGESPNPKSSKDEQQKGNYFKTLPSKIKNIESMKKEDFDPRLLTTQQNRYLKRVITRNTMVQKRSTSLASAVGDMKVNGVLRINKHPIGIAKPVKKERKNKNKS